MRYGVQPSNLSEWMALKLEKIPLPVLDTLLPILQARALIAANNYGVLRLLARSAGTAAEIAAQLSLDAECLGLVLRVLQSMGYVARKDGRWSLSPAGRRYFGPEAPEGYDAFVEYGVPQWRFVERLDEVLRTGRGIDFHAHQTADEWSAYQRAMLENARGFAWFVAAHTPVAPGATSCLDLAGAHGYVGAMLCERHPPMRSIVLDRAEALATAPSPSASASWARLVTYREGDLLTSDFGTGHDVVLLANILHHFDEATDAQILRRAHAALKPGGAISIFDIETPRDDQPPESAGDCLALYFRITSTASCAGADDYAAWLEAAGFESVRVVRSIRMPSRMLIVGAARGGR